MTAFSTHKISLALGTFHIFHFAEVHQKKDASTGQNNIF